jgi:AraC-like DNA-binding protein
MAANRGAAMANPSFAILPRKTQWCYRASVPVEVLSESAASMRHLVRAAGGQGLQLDEGPSAGAPIFHARVPIEHAQRQWEHAVRELGPGVPLLVAHKRPEDRISPLYFAAMSCPTIGEALAVTVRYWSYATDGCRARLIHEGRTVRLQLDPRSQPSLGARLGIEYLLADLVRSGRELSGGAWRPVELVLGHRPPITLADWECACGVATRVDPAAPGLVMARDSLEQPIRDRLSSAVGRFFVDLLDWLTPRSAIAMSATERVDALLVDEFAGARPPFDEIAHRLAMSTRSLRRQLAAEGTSYHDLLDRVRRDEAVRQVARDARQIKAIARTLGFSDPRGFRRAFRRWTGLTPQQFRDRQRRHC